jgi:hypothetical protein
MIPGEYDIVIYRGSTWTINVSKKDANDVYIDFDADYINQPGAGDGKIEMEIRPAWRGSPPDVPKLSEPLATLSTATGEITVSTTVITLTLSAAVTAALDFNTGAYDIELVTGDATPVVDKLLFGIVTVKDEKTVT